MELVEKTVTSFDGTDITYYKTGNAKGKTIVLSNGLGGNIYAWKYFIEYFKDRFQIVSWDYRGLYNSLSPQDQTSFTVLDHINDLLTILDKEGIKNAIFAGWSMGVQLNFELYRLKPELFEAMIIINGTYGSPLKTAFNSPLIEKVAPLLFDFMEKNYQRLNAFGTFFEENRYVLKLLKLVGLMAEPLEESLFFELSKDYVHLNFSNYAKIFRYLADHNARDVLEKVKVPTLIICGGKDRFTPKGISIKMHKLIENSELLEILDATHYAPIEFPDIVNLRIEKFLRDKGFLS